MCENHVPVSARAWAGILLISVALATSLPATARNGATLTGRVFDPEGVAIPNAVVTLWWNDIGPEMSWNGAPNKHKPPHTKTLSVITDSGGSFSVKLYPGIWDVFVHADGIRPICQIVGLGIGKSENLQLHMKERVRKMQE